MENERIDFEPIDFNELSTEAAVMTMVERAVERSASDLFLIAAEVSASLRDRRRTAASGGAEARAG